MDAFPGRGRPDAPVKLASLLRFPADRYGKRFRSIVAAIDSIHDVSPAEPIEILVTKDRDAVGRYNRHAGTGRPISIEVSRRNDSMEWTLVHEIGHFLESALIPGAAFGVRPWSFDPIMTGWRLAVRDTEAYRRLDELATTNMGFRGVPAPSLRFLAYLMSDQELWARCYAQWVMLRSGHEALVDQFRRGGSRPSVYPLQWVESDFGPVAAELDALFQGIGWRP